MINYFDNASTTYRKPRCIYRSIKLFKRIGANISRGINDHSCSEVVNKTRENLKKLVGANDSYTVIFSQSATYSINQILRGLDYRKIHNVFISEFEHNSVLRTLYDLQSQYGFKLHTLKYDNFEFDVDLIEKQFKNVQPDLVVVSHISNVCGKVQKFEKVFQMAHQYKAITMLDMAQSCGLVQVNISKTNVDIAIFAGHKTLYALTGVGGAIIKRSLSIAPSITGGTGKDSASGEMPKYYPDKFEPGTQNILGIMSLYLSTRYLLKKGYNNIYKIEKQNYDRLKRVLGYSKVLKIIDTGADSCSIVSCYSERYAPDNFEEFFNKHKVCIRMGLQCSPISHKKIGTFPSGTLRFSIGLFTRKREFRALQMVIKKMNKHFLSKK